MKTLAFIFLAVLFFFPATAQTSYFVENDSLRVQFRTNNQNGLGLFSIEHHHLILIPDYQPPLFRLDLETPSADIGLDATSGWQQITWQSTDSTSAVIRFAQPMDTLAPDSLEVLVYVDLDGNGIDWDMEVRGLGQSSLYLVYFPQIDLTAPGNDYAFVPQYSGKLVHNPALDTVWDYHAHYPDGWESTMSYMAYYGDDYGIYFGMHDPEANFKYFGLSVPVRRELRSDVVWLAPDTGRPGNDWEMPGKFRWEVFRGDWYDAAMIYRRWASQHAAWWPSNDSIRLARRQKMSATGLWCYAFMDDETDMQLMEDDMREFAAYFDFPVGFVMYNWNYHDRDDDYPAYFPERTGLDSLIAHLHRDDSVRLVPYINGRMYDTDLPDYQTHGYPHAAKQSDETTVWTQHFNGNTFAVMYPTRRPWQDTLRYATDQLSNRLHTDGVYFDQVGAAGTVPCFDSSHDHPRGGGHHWFSGYQNLLQRSAEIQTPSQFMTTEGGGDFIANRFEGLYTLGWQTTGLVPAYMAVYGGTVDLFGYTTGTSMYGDQRFFGRMGLAASYGIQPGGLSMWIALHRDNMTAERRQALEYVRDLGRMRYRLRNFMSFGRFLRPLNLQGAVPTVSFTMWDRGTARDTTAPAVQHSIWQSGDSVCVYLTNIRRYDPAGSPAAVDFSFRFEAGRYALAYPVEMYVMTPTGESRRTVLNADSDIQVSLNDLETKAYIFKGNALNTASSRTKSLRLIPNPARENFRIENLPEGAELRISDMSGRIMRYIHYRRNTPVEVNGWPAGLYLITAKRGDSSYRGILIKH
ncbi:MAG: T9SS type A sorting domain-containing protein [Chlorobi bacterium]|nr:T9SS type A sorting domain-containing protein [Chlorobiota bacterium]